MTDQPTADAADPMDSLAEAVVAVDGVVGLHAGMFGEVGTFLPGRRIAGIAQRDGGTEVHVSLEFGSDVRDVAERVRRAAAVVVDGPVHVVIEDVVSR